METKEILAKNLIACRKKAGLTQQQLAEKLSYSDKAVSKWERAEAIPDVLVLKQIADIYGIKIDDLISEDNAERKVKVKHTLSTAKHWLIVGLSAGLVWLIATIVMVVWLLFDRSAPIAKFAYLTALPVSFIVVVVFSCIWGRVWQTAISVSALIWTLCVLLNTLLNALISLENSWLIFLIGAALQVLVVLWFLLMFVLKKGASINDKTFGKRKVEQPTDATNQTNRQ